MYKSGEVTHVLRDGEVTALICSDRAWESYLRETAAGLPGADRAHRRASWTSRRAATRACCAFERLPQAPDADDLTAVARAGHQAPDGRASRAPATSR